MLNHNSLLIVCLCVVLASSDSAFGASFTFREVTASNLPPLVFASVAWKDINGDSFPDLLYVGAAPDDTYHSLILLNSGGTGSFVTAPFSAQLEGVQQGSVGWADFNRDGYQDFFIFGSTSQAYVYAGQKNTGFNLTYTSLPGSQIPPARWQSMANWLDYNNDGYADIFVCGVPWNCYLYRYEEASGGFTDATPSAIAAFQGTSIGGSSAADYDKDGLVDIFVTGSGAGGSVQAGLFRQNPPGVFTDSGTAFRGMNWAAATFADLNKDTYPDIVLAGSSLWNPVTPDVAVYINNRQGGFNELATALIPAAYSSLDAGDFNGDGYPDLIICGDNANFIPTCSLWQNNRNLTFTKVDAGIVDLTWPSATFADFNNDGLLDILVTGITASSTRVAKLYQNLGPTCINGAIQLSADKGWICNCASGWTGDTCNITIATCPTVTCLDTGACVATLADCVTEPSTPEGELVEQQIVNSQVVIDVSASTSIDLLSSADASLRGQITIPEGVFGDDSTVTAVLVVKSVPLSTVTAANVEISDIFSVVIDLSFDGINTTTFAQPINITLVVSQMPPGTCLAYLHGNTWICEDRNPVALPGGLAYGLTTHFTSFGMLLDPNGGNNNGGDGDGFDNVLLAPIIVSVVVALFVVVVVSAGILVFFWWKRRRMVRDLTQSSRTGFDEEEN